MKRCKHADRTAHTLVVRTIVTDGVPRRIVRLQCDRCHAWLSLGPAVVRDEYQTQIELLIAEHIADICLLWEPKDQDERIEEMLEQTLAFDAFMSMTTTEAKERYGVDLDDLTYSRRANGGTE